LFAIASAVFYGQKFRVKRFVGPAPWRVLGSEIDDPVHLHDDVLVAIDAPRSLMNCLPSFIAGLIDALNLNAGERVVHDSWPPIATITATPRTKSSLPP
jgi:hypothetical protein